MSSSAFSIPLLKKLVFYLFMSDREVKRINRDPVCRFTSQMPITARVGLGARSQSRSPIWVAESPSLGPAMLLPEPRSVRTLERGVSFKVGTAVSWSLGWIPAAPALSVFRILFPSFFCFNFESLALNYVQKSGLYFHFYQNNEH